MKKIILAMVALLTMLTSCSKSNIFENQDNLKFENSELIEDWTALQLQLVKNSSGITHIAYSRHFAYTGIALYEALVNGDKQYKSLKYQLNGELALPAAPQGKPLYWPASANAAVAEMLRHFYAAKPANVQRIDSLEQVYASMYKSLVKDSAYLLPAVEFGKKIATVIIDWSKTDGSTNVNIPYSPLGEGYWEPTPPANAAANVPGWANVRTILPGSTNNTSPAPPPAFSKVEGSSFYTMVKELYDISLTLSSEQKAAADFWDDAPNGKYITVFGHWFSIFKQILHNENINLMKAAEAYLRLGITLNEAGIGTWKIKYTYNMLRPVTYIRKHMGFTNWNSYITTPPHPEYVAAHATLSASAAYALETVFGKNYSFTDHTYDALGMAPRSFNSLEAAGREAGLSRLFGGIHYRPSIDTGNSVGKKTGKNVRQLLSLHRYTSAK
ncbi:vanadium-dependent haloperoxidase [Agriterribacter sp.]|uniref:vanadium-dependent haloperoxidase n=1 Tax=Agriterribacter sp. TaxID=2821509 RepID=UPI002CA9A8CA|nr:vanadium-dependent haloperoxidase [Agriterribacter sp.]HTN06621.1 vanadium-dependent haloperoxidase [Agriterribacter sp.]